MDVGSASVAADADRYFDLGFEDGEDSEVTWVDEVKEGPELDEVVLEGGAGEDDSMVGLLDRLLAEKTYVETRNDTYPELFARNRDVRIRVSDLMSLIQDSVFPLLIE